VTRIIVIIIIMQLLLKLYYERKLYSFPIIFLLLSASFLQTCSA